ncbi:hypothetical protein ABT301_07120 [Streptomyces sp. NPDC000987]|uniref:hypothetical protein n=1 Tax=Streptomyces sp. NPDC000987 TaxID=3154374 RepID=UPI00332CE4A0
MRPVTRAVPATGAARPPAVAVLAAVVLTLLAVLGAAGPPTGTTAGPTAGTRVGPSPAAAVETAGGTTVGGATAGHRRDTVPHAGDGCEAVCGVRAATRQEPHSEHPPPRAHLATCGPGTHIASPRSAPLPAPTGHTPSSDPHTPHDRGRAPPVRSGT